MRGIDLDIADGEFTVLVGPSGCGKSTLLRTIAGLEDISEGEIEIGGEVVNDMRPRDRDVAMVFQDYALYPHMTVEKNIGFGLRGAQDARSPKSTSASVAQPRDARHHRLLDRFPRQLSGGQRQRVAIGRAIVRNPQIFLFDEPLSNLDAQLRDEMRGEIKRLHQEIATTMIYVTHDQIEAMTLADRIVLMRDGGIEQQGTPADLFERPASRFVAGFLGSPKMSFLPGRVVAFRKAWRPSRSTAPPFRFRCPAAHAARVATTGARVLLGLRPEHIVRAQGASPGEGMIRLDATSRAPAADRIAHLRDISDWRRVGAGGTSGARRQSSRRDHSTRCQSQSGVAFRCRDGIGASILTAKTMSHWPRWRRPAGRVVRCVTHASPRLKGERCDPEMRLLRIAAALRASRWRSEPL